MTNKLINKELMKAPELSLVTGKENKELCEEILRHFDTVPQGMTTFQIQKFILSDLDFPTSDSKWWQAKLELWVRMQNIVSMHYDHRKRVAKIKELKATVEELDFNTKTSVIIDEDLRKIKKRLNDAKAEALQVEIDENEFALVCIQKGVSDKLKEMWAFWDSMVELEKEMTFSKIDKNEQEEDYWITKAKTTPELVNRYPEVFTDKYEMTKSHRNIFK